MPQPSNSVPDDFQLRVVRYLDQSLSPDELTAFEAELQKSAEKRQWFAELSIQSSCIHEILRDDAARLPAAALPRPHRRLRLILTLAAGIALGFGSAALARSFSRNAGTPALSVFADSFEMPPPPRVDGVPTVPGFWSGDYNACVEAENGVKPLDGTRMLKFIRADFAGRHEPGGSAGDLFRLVDLRAAGPAAAAGESVASVQASFCSQSYPDSQLFDCGITVYALEDLPTPDKVQSFMRRHWLTLNAAPQPLPDTIEQLNHTSLAASQQTQLLPSDGPAWTKVRTEMRLPANARYLMVRLFVAARHARHTPEEDAGVEFSGQYADAVTISISPL